MKNQFEFLNQLVHILFQSTILSFILKRRYYSVSLELSGLTFLMEIT